MHGVMLNFITIAQLLGVISPAAATRRRGDQFGAGTPGCLVRKRRTRSYVPSRSIFLSFFRLGDRRHALESFLGSVGVLGALLSLARQPVVGHRPGRDGCPLVSQRGRADGAFDCTALDLAAHQTVGPLWHRQDVLMWLYIAAIGLSLVWGLPTDPAFEQKTDVFQKMIKVAIFAFMLTHVVTTPTELKRVLWFMFCVGGVYLAVAAKELPPSSFNEGRLDHFGGPDFFDSNCIAAHFVVMGILGVALLLTSSGLWTRLMCLGGGALIVNAIILARSRGAFLGIGAAGLAALVLADRQIRKHVAWLMPLVIVAGLYLADSDFLERMGTITADAEQRDRSAETRLLIWQSAWSMFLDHPFGVGAGNFYSIIGQYSADLAGRDTHNTFFRCLAELGLPARPCSWPCSSTLLESCNAVDGRLSNCRESIWPALP